MVKMIFKQSILKEEIIKYLIILFVGLIVPIALIIIVLINHDDLKLLMIFILLFYIPIFFLLNIFGLKNLEWFVIYKDKMEARCLFGIKNIVYYDKIISIEEVAINLTSRGMEKQFYILNDGRKNNNSLLNINSCYNKKKFNFRIYKNTELENYITNNLNINVNYEHYR